MDKSFLVLFFKKELLLGFTPMILGHDPDATVIIRPKWRWSKWAASFVAAALPIVLVTFIILHHRPRGLALMDEAGILASRPAEIMVFRFAQAPGILVADFPSLHAQARALNRAAIFLELAGVLRDHVPDDADVTAAVTGAHLDYDRFYYGHDYRAADLQRMWAMMAKAGVALLPEEAALRTTLESAARQPGGFGAVISLPPAGQGLQDAAGRAAILRHELSHGFYFTDPAYAAAVHAFWENGLSATQRAGFRRFLAGEMYDSSNEELMENEMQAYLVHTPDTRFFRPGDAGLRVDEAAGLRRMFVAGMPPGWLQASDMP